MSPIRRGTQNVINCYRGDTQISAIYRGTALIWALNLDAGFANATVDVDASVRSYRTTSHLWSTLGISEEVVNRPYQVSQGDLLMLYTIADSGVTGDFVVPSGFTEMGRIIGSPGARLIVSYKVAGASEPATYTYPRYATGSDGVSMLISVKDWSGSTANLRSAFSSASNTSTNAPSVTPATARNLLLTAIATDDDVSARSWGWIPPVQAGTVGYAHNSSYWSSGSVSQEAWNSSSATGTRTWNVNTSSVQTTRLTASVTIPSGTVTKTITEFLSDHTHTKGSGGALTDATNLTFQDSTGLSSTYHLFADGLDWDKNVGIMIYGDGSSEYGLAPAQITSQSPYLLYGSTGLIAVAKKHNMVLLTPRAPGTACNDGDGVCWYDHSQDNTTPWQKLEWSNELISYVLKRYDIDRRRMAIGGYSSGAQWTASWWGPKYGSQVMLEGVAVHISYGGQPRIMPNISANYKANVAQVWNTGDQDTSWTQPTWDDGIQTGRAWYQNNGFAVTRVDTVPGVGHNRYNTTTMVGEFGSIMDQYITEYVRPAVDIYMTPDASDQGTFQSNLVEDPSDPGTFISTGLTPDENDPGTFVS